MAEYIDREALIAEIQKNIKTYWNEGSGGYYLAEDALNYSVKTAPTADVVPKSEVERLNAVIKEMDEQRAYTINMLGESLETAKSEIEMLQGALKAEEPHNELTMEMAQKALKNAKAEVAREIFEEIEKIVVKVRVEDTKNFVLSEKQFAELKKKYTGEKECPNCRYFVGCEKAIWTGVCDEYTEVKNDK